MLRQIKRYRGVTLIEMMLVLFIMSLIAVSVIQYANRQRDEAASKVLGEKLYIYGQAVRAYLLDNQAAIRGTPQGDLSGESPSGEKYTFTGVSWLQNPPKGTANPNPELNANPYLEDTFSFNTGMHPLFVGPVVGVSDDEVITTVEFRTAGDNTSPLFVTVTIPGLYRDAKGVPVPMPDLSVRAADFANKFYSSIAGGSAFLYKYGVPTEANYPLPTDGDYTKAFIVGELRDIAEQEDYLRVDGQNYMKQSIVLAEPTDDAPFAAPTDVGARNIMGVERIYFDSTQEGVPTGITNIDAILFNNTHQDKLKTIEGLNSIEFANDAGASISALDTIQFTGSGSALSNLQVINMSKPTDALAGIVNVNKLVFSGKSSALPAIQFVEFPGKISNVNSITMSKAGAGLFSGRIVFGSGATLSDMKVEDSKTGDVILGGSASNRFCFLTRVRLNTKDSQCEVYIDGSGWRLDEKNGANCTARCVIFLGF